MYILFGVTYFLERIPVEERDEYESMKGLLLIVKIVQCIV